MLQILQEAGGSTVREAAQLKTEFEQKLGLESRLTQAQFRVLETQQQALHQKKVEMQQQIDTLQ